MYTIVSYKRKTGGCGGCMHSCPKKLEFLLAKTYSRMVGRNPPPEIMSRILDIESCSWYKEDVEKDSLSHTSPKERNMSAEKSQTNSNTNSGDAAGAEELLKEMLKKKLEEEAKAKAAAEAEEKGFFASAIDVMDDWRGVIGTVAGLAIGAGAAYWYLDGGSSNCPMSESINPE